VAHATLEAHQPFRDFRYRTTRRDGTVLYMTTSGKPVFDGAGHFWGYRGVSSDVTAAVRAAQTEEALHQAQAALACVTRVLTLGEITTSIAHEVNQPLAAMVTNGNACVRWLAGDPPNLAEAREAVEAMIRHGHRASDVIRRIRALVQNAPPRQEWLDINALIREVMALVHSDGHHQGVALQTDLPRVVGDRTRCNKCC
jgi:C4-dicarboxylate-specific signal transduction histidine kinase